MVDIDQWIDNERVAVGTCEGCGQTLRHWERTKRAQCGILLCEECAQEVPCCISNHVRSSQIDPVPLRLPFPEPESTVRRTLAHMQSTTINSMCPWPFQR